MSLVAAFQGRLSEALGQETAYSEDTVDAALNQVTEEYVLGSYREGLDHLELLALAEEYAIHNEAVRAGGLRPLVHGLVAYRGAGESTGSALADAVRGQGPFAVRQLRASRQHLTAAVFARTDGDAQHRTKVLAWLAGFHHTATLRNAPIPTVR
jgi:hypothetical protein